VTRPGQPWGKRDDMRVHEAEPFNAEPPPGALANSATTPADAFYSRCHGPVPKIDPASWRLTVEGLVRQPLTLSLDDLRTAFAEHTLTATLQCAGNRRAALAAVRDIPGEHPWGDGATATADWTGVRLSDVLIAAGVSPSADAHVAFAAPDVSETAKPPQTYGGSVPLSKAVSPEVLLAWAMNGQPLPPVHGAPLRVVVPGWIGARSVKWLRGITVQDAPSDNYFQSVAYRLLPPQPDPSGAGADGFALGPIALNSAILTPTDGDIVPAGRVEVTGYAFAGDGRGVARVDVSADGGRSWLQAELCDDQGRWAWRLWRAEVHLRPGENPLVARAWDTTAAVQPEHPAPVWNPKGYVNNSWPRVTVHAASRQPADVQELPS
jgi:sulfite oxidase